jgi:hypothetical protein
MRVTMLAWIFAGLDLGAASLAVFNDSEDAVKQSGVGAVKTIVAQEGKASGDGFSIRFVGACDLAAKNPKPWGLDGGPLSKVGAAQFWRSINRKPNDAFSRDPDGRTFAIGFVVMGPTYVTTVLEDWDTHYALLSDYGSGMIRGKPRYIGTVLKPLQVDHGFTYRLEAKPTQGKEILRFNEGAKEFPEGFSFAFEEPEGINLVKADERKTEEVPLVRFRVITTVPPELRDMELELATNDPAPKSEIPLLTNYCLTMKGEKVGEKYKGKIVFEMRLPAKPAKKRVFVLTAKQRTLIEFRNIPLAPAK